MRRAVCLIFHSRCTGRRRAAFILTNFYRADFRVLSTRRDESYGKHVNIYTELAPRVDLRQHCCENERVRSAGDISHPPSHAENTLRSHYDVALSFFYQIKRRNDVVNSRSVRPFVHWFVRLPACLSACRTSKKIRRR